MVTAFAGAAVLFGTTTAAASPVHTDYIRYFSGSHCHPKRHALCVFRDAGYSGGGLVLQRGDKIPSLPSFHFNDAMSAWANDAGVTCHWYTNSGYRGRHHKMVDGFRVKLPSGENDTASSIRCGW